MSKIGALAVLIRLFCPSIHSQSIYFPPLDEGAWDTISLAELGWDESQLPPLYQFLQDNNTKAFRVLKNGKMAVEKYFGIMEIVRVTGLGYKTIYQYRELVNKYHPSLGEKEEEQT